MQINFLKYRKLYYTFSGILILVSVFSLIIYRLNFGVDFTGGTQMQLAFNGDRISNEKVQEMLSDLKLGNLSLQQVGDKELILEMENINEDTHQKILDKLGGSVEEESFESVGPVIGKELQKKTWIFAILVLIAIIFFIAFAFRRASKPISSWQYGVVAALVAFFHDILIPLGIFSLLGKVFGVAVTIPIVVGLLTILGYSVHDTIVVFDRIRENILRNRDSSFEEIVNKSLRQTLIRSINTSLTSLIVLLAMFFFGGETLKYFTLVLILGITTGTYSSIFIASPILVTWLNRRKKI